MDNFTDTCLQYNANIIICSIISQLYMSLLYENNKGHKADYFLSSQLFKPVQIQIKLEWIEPSSEKFAYFWSDEHQFDH